MPRTRIKICGVKDVETALVAAAAGADAIGLAFIEKSPRYVEVEIARRIVAALPAFVEPVGLFVDAEPEHVRQVAEQVGLRTIQVHGEEGPGYLRSVSPCRVLKSIPYDADRFADRLAPWRNPPANLAALLVDAPPLPGSELTGGSGTAFNWTALADHLEAGAMDDLPPLILAGGLTPDNVAEAIGVVRPYAVDVSSGVESSRGVKDHARIAAFCAAVRRADQAVHNDRLT